MGSLVALIVAYPAGVRPDLEQVREFARRAGIPATEAIAVVGTQLEGAVSAHKHTLKGVVLTAGLACLIHKIELLLAKTTAKIIAVCVDAINTTHCYIAKSISEAFAFTEQLKPDLQVATATASNMA